MDIERLTIEEFLEHRREIEAELGDRKHNWAGEYQEAAELVLEDVEDELGDVERSSVEPDFGAGLRVV